MTLLRRLLARLFPETEQDRMIRELIEQDEAYRRRQAERTAEAMHYFEADT